MRSRRHTLTAVIALVTLALSLASCSNSGSASLGHQACEEVATSLKTFADAQKATPQERQKLVNKAAIELREATPNAALAAVSDTDWQALSATLSEASRVPEKYLVQALSAQCAQTLS